MTIAQAASISVPPKLFQRLIAYASIVFGILTTQLQAIHLSPLASAILGVFGLMLHPDTSVTVPSSTVTVKTPTT